ncbi:MAG: hypothetical protein JNK49_05620 [Planctomycetes bacterium]|nr:hypothetical protein [Planctomycetota bacterium]
MKRFVWFLVLLAGGLALLWWAVGDDPVLSGGRVPHEVLSGRAGAPAGAVAAVPDAVPDAAAAAAARPQEPGAVGQGVPLQTAQGTGSWQASGPFHYPVVRSVPQPDGSKRNETLYVVDAAGSRPIGDGRQQIDGLRVDIHEAGQLAAVVRARTAFAELGRDAGGKVSIREDKAFDLRDVELEAPEASPWAGLSARLGRAVVEAGSAAVAIRTPDEREPVLVEFRGQPAVTVRGLGFTADLPRGRGLAAGAVRTLRFTILHEPVLATAGAEVRCRGQLEYREERVGGAGELTMVEGVRGTFTGLGGAAFGGVPGASLEGAAATVLADRAHVWLRRPEPAADAAGGSRAAGGWRRLELHGAPVQVVAGGLQLAAPRCVLLPNGMGEPSVLVADGGAAHCHAELPTAAVPLQRDATDRLPPAPIDGSSPERLVLARIGADAAAALRGFGFPAWTLRGLDAVQAVHLQGAAALTSDGRRTTAAQGLELVQFGAGGAGAVTGSGAVDLVLPPKDPTGVPVHATGNQGFRVTKARGRELLQLGPPLAAGLEAPAADPAFGSHHYTVQLGKALLRGVGACQVEQTGPTAVVALRAPTPAIELELPDGRGSFRAVRSVLAELRGEDLVDWELVGTPAVLVGQRRGATLTAQAPVLRQLGLAGMRLLPSSAASARHGASPAWFADLPPTAHQPRLQIAQTGVAQAAGAEQLPFDLTLTAPQIDLHHEGGERATVVATAVGEQLVTGSGTFVRQGAVRPSLLQFQGQCLRLLPSLVAPTALGWHHGGVSAAFAEAMAPAASSPWLVADRIDRVVLDDDEHGRVEGTAHRLWLALGSESALFTGDAAAAVPAVVRRSRADESVVARGAAVRLWRDPEPRMQVRRAFADSAAQYLPTVELHRPDAAERLAHLQVVCRGDIDVLPAEVRFGGPVVADGLDAASALDPDGLHVEAQTFQVFRHPRTGEVLRLVAREVALDWTRLRARCRDLEVDLRRERLVASDPVEAEVWLPNGLRFAAEHVLVLYRAMAVEATNGSVLRRDVAEAGR